ncbi:hypothetical protein J6590_028816 [Homalodisca vitripennis]|nr:hypothetical protein J6590_028816 [Homalodisca vitripennis]
MPRRLRCTKRFLASTVFYTADEFMTFDWVTEQLRIWMNGHNAWFYRREVQGFPSFLVRPTSVLNDFHMMRHSSFMLKILNNLRTIKKSLSVLPVLRAPADVPLSGSEKCVAARLIEISRSRVTLAARHFSGKSGRVEAETELDFD